MSLLAHNIILYISRKSQDPPKPLELINPMKLQNMKINTQGSVYFYTLITSYLKKNEGKAVLFIIASKRIKPSKK